MRALRWVHRGSTYGAVLLVVMLGTQATPAHSGAKVGAFNERAHLDTSQVIDGPTVGPPPPVVAWP
jgi:hypothetical protein